ncbi:DUF378 domain-containing protein [Salimicrobium halophilum]|uniref:DUF378 domain-containing protein n=1 Tax=Salimicrobium halophilum TaxID=86666 RepID=A0A1G8VAT2_9BACI|nr:DUF378 domain-containing protein [Salimicrobium halophilum]SDJ63226.1 hypothetical protein SAMN04490247_2619 [Salimicrobium halophilum]
MNTLQRISLIVILIGAINWGLIGIFQYDLVAGLFGGGEQMNPVARTIYTLVGLAGIIGFSFFNWGPNDKKEPAMES